jgi:AcrR family transcriptional regulator
MRTVNPIQHEANRNRILTAARRLFASQGVKETSMSQVAKVCRVTKATLYHYYEGKEDILNGIFARSLSLQERFADGVRPEGSLEDTLAVVARNYLDLIGQEESLEIMKIFHSEGVKSSTVCRHYNNQIQERYERYIRLGIERNILPDVDFGILRNVVFTFFGSLEHHYLHAHVLKTEFVKGGDEAYVRFLAKMFAKALEVIGQLAAEGRIPRAGGKSAATGGRETTP